MTNERENLDHDTKQWIDAVDRAISRVPREDAVAPTLLLERAEFGQRAQIADCRDALACAIANADRAQDVQLALTRLAREDERFARDEAGTCARHREALSHNALEGKLDRDSREAVAIADRSSARDVAARDRAQRDHEFDREHALRCAEMTLARTIASTDRWFRFVAQLAWMVVVACLATYLLGCARRVGPVRTPDQQAAAAVEVRVVCARSEVDVTDGSVTASFVPHKGSGVVVSSTEVLTAAHVAACHDPRRGADAFVAGVVKFADGTSRAAELLSYDNERDIARLNVTGPPLRVAPIGYARPTKWAHACVVSAVPERARRCGQVNEIADRWREQAIIDGHMLTEVYAGNSGSGVYDARGRLIGLATNGRSCVRDPSKSCGGGFTTTWRVRR